MKALATNCYWVVYNPNGAFIKEGDPAPLDLIPRNGVTRFEMLESAFSHGIRINTWNKRSREQIASYIRQHKYAGQIGHLHRLFDLKED